MDRIRSTFTLTALQRVRDSARAREVELKYVNLTPQHYDELRADLKERLGLDLPPENNDIPVIVLGLQINVWRPSINAKALRPARRHNNPGK